MASFKIATSGQEDDLHCGTSHAPKPTKINVLSWGFVQIASGGRSSNCGKSKRGARICWAWLVMAFLHEWRDER